MTARFHPRRAARPSGALFLAGTVAGILAFSSEQALAGSVACGDTITADTKLDADLVDCPNNGIVIGANGVTLDLNGHTIDGDGELGDDCALTFPGELCDVGVASEKHNRLTIKGGRIKEFGEGLLTDKAKHVHLRRLTVSRNLDAGVLILRSRDARLRRSTVARNAFLGIAYIRVTRSDVSRTSVLANGVDTDLPGVALFAVGLFGSDHVRVQQNTISRNGDIGLLAVEANANLISENRLADNPEAGMLLLGDRNIGSDRNAIRHNRVLRVGDGIIIRGNRNAIARNHLSRISPPPECEIGCATGIAVEAGRRNRVAHNRVRHAGGAGVRIGLDHDIAPEAPKVRGTVVRGNRLRHGNRDGVMIETTARQTVLQRNRSRGSRDDGFDVESETTTLTGNVARRNDDLGIQAVHGVIDGGGNRASGNGDSRQCVNVTC